MDQVLAAFVADGPRLLASVVVFAVFFLVARLIRARQSIALAFAFTPLLMFFIVQGLARSDLLVHLL